MAKLGVLQQIKMDYPKRKNSKIRSNRATSSLSDDKNSEKEEKLIEGLRTVKLRSKFDLNKAREIFRN